MTARLVAFGRRHPSVAAILFWAFVAVTAGVGLVVALVVALVGERAWMRRNARRAAA